MCGCLFKAVYVTRVNAVRLWGEKEQQEKPMIESCGKEVVGVMMAEVGAVPSVQSKKFS